MKKIWNPYITKRESVISNILDHCGPFWTTSGTILDHSRTILDHFWAITDHCGPFWDILSHFEPFWNIFGPFHKEKKWFLPVILSWWCCCCCHLKTLSQSSDCSSTQSLADSVSCCLGNWFVDFPFWSCRLAIFLQSSLTRRVSVITK